MSPFRVAILVLAVTMVSATHDQKKVQVTQVEYVQQEVVRPVVVERRPVVVERRPVVVDRRPVVVESRPVVVDRRPVVVDRRPVVVESRPVVYEREHEPARKTVHVKPVHAKPIHHVVHHEEQEVQVVKVHRPSPVCRPDPFHLLPAHDRCSPVSYCNLSWNRICAITEGIERRMAHKGWADQHRYCREEATGEVTNEAAARRYCEVGHRRDRAAKYCRCMGRHNIHENDWLVAAERACH